MKRQHPSTAHKRCAKLFALLSDYIDGKLDGRLCAELERHLEVCTACKGFLESLRNTVALCAEGAAERLSPEAAAQTRALLLEECRRVLEQHGRPRPHPPKAPGCCGCG